MYDHTHIMVTAVPLSVMQCDDVTLQNQSINDTDNTIMMLCFQMQGLGCAIFVIWIIQKESKEEAQLDLAR